MIVDIMVIIKIVYSNENNVEYEYELSVFTKDLYLYFRIYSLFEAPEQWYLVTVNIRSLYCQIKNQNV